MLLILCIAIDLYNNVHCYYLLYTGLVNEIVSSLSLKDLQLKTCYLKQTPLAFIGPSTLNFTMASQWCTHSGPDYLPKSVLTLETGLLLVHFGQEHLLCLNHFTEQFFKECEVCVEF